MRGSLHSQVEALFHNIASLGIGTSRHRLKKSKALHPYLIHSDNTRHTYLRVWHAIAEHGRLFYQLRYIDDLTPQIVRAWLEAQAAARVSSTTMRTYRAAVSKLSHVLAEHKRRKEWTNSKRHSPKR